MQGYPSMGNHVVDPTLDSCCQRELEDSRKYSALRRTLQRHDVVAERERRRRNLVQASDFDGCRCLYVPRLDGGGDYRALSILRKQRQQQMSTLNMGEELYCVDIAEVQEDDVFPNSERSNVEKDDEKDEVDEEEEEDEFDYLLDEDLPGQSEELKLIEEQRRAELEMEMLEKEIQLQHGYGVHRQMHPSHALKAAGLVPGSRDPPPCVVVHLFDPDSMQSASLDLYLEKLATQMRGTKFLRTNGRGTLRSEATLVEKVLPRIRANADLPLLIAVRNGVVVQTSPGLQIFGDSRRYSENNDQEASILPEAVYEWLDQLGVLHERPPPLEALCRIRPEEEVLMDYLAKQKPSSPPQMEEFFKCGMPGCQKLFAHQHVGVETKEQSGLVVSESEILGQS